MNHRIYNGMQNILSVIVKTVGLVITESFHYLTIACCFFQPLEQLKYSHLRAPKPTPVLLISYIPKIFLHPFLVPLLLAERLGASRHGFDVEISNQQNLVPPEGQTEGSKMGWKRLSCHLSKSVGEEKHIQRVSLDLFLL